MAQARKKQARKTLARKTTAGQAQASGTNATQQSEIDDLRAAAALVVEKERKRRKRAAKRARRRKQQREKEQLAAVHRMRQSVEVIKWCIVGIAAIMLIGIIIAIWTLSALNKEVEKVQGYVSEVQTEVERVRDALRNPMQSVGSAFGKELDDKLKSYLGDKLAPEK